MITTILFIIVILFAWYKPPVAFALLLQTNVVRSLAEINYTDPCFYCTMDSNPVLGAVLPISAFIVILFKLDLNNKTVIYKFDKFDILFGLILVSLIFSTITSYSIKDSIEYTVMFLVLAFPYYFMVKIYFQNSQKEFQIEIISFFKTTLYLSLFFALLAIYIARYNNVNVWRLTIPGVHPIPFSQLIGFGILISIIILLTKKSNLFYNIKIKFNIIILISLFLLIVQFATNTRGVLISLIIAIIFLLKMNPIKIKKIYLYSGVFGFVLILTIVLSQLDLDYYFKRFQKIAEDISIIERIKVYFESFTIFYKTHFLGTGPGAFKYYSFLDYPHNLFLENMAVLGIMGIIVNIYFTFLILWLFINSKMWKNNTFLIFSISIFIFYFVESMFSFTLWMHKGLFLSLALISITYHKNEK